LPPLLCLRGGAPFEQVLAADEEGGRACARWRRPSSRPECAISTTFSATMAEPKATSRASAVKWPRKVTSRLFGQSAFTMSKVGAMNRLRISSACHCAAWRERQQRPAGDRRQHPEDRRQRAAQIVDHLPARQPRNAELRIEDHRQQLPVAARPAVLARGVDRSGSDSPRPPRRRSPARRAKNAFQQVVAQHRVFRHLAGKRGLHGVDVVEALAGEGAFAEHVLIEVGDREDVGVEPRLAENTRWKNEASSPVVSDGVTRGCRIE
jgi:hypothetical protein